MRLAGQRRSAAIGSIWKIIERKQGSEIGLLSMAVKDGTLAPGREIGEAGYMSPVALACKFRFGLAGLPISNDGVHGLGRPRLKWSGSVA